MIDKFVELVQQARRTDQKIAAVVAVYSPRQLAARTAIQSRNISGSAIQSAQNTAAVATARRQNRMSKVMSVALTALDASEGDEAIKQMKKREQIAGLIQKYSKFVESKMLLEEVEREQVFQMLLALFDRSSEIATQHSLAPSLLIHKRCVAALVNFASIDGCGPVLCRSGCLDALVSTLEFFCIGLLGHGLPLAELDLSGSYVPRVDAIRCELPVSYSEERDMEETLAGIVSGITMFFMSALQEVAVRTHLVSTIPASIQTLTSSAKVLLCYGKKNKIYLDAAHDILVAVAGLALNAHGCKEMDKQGTIDMCINFVCLVPDSPLILEACVLLLQNIALNYEPGLEKMMARYTKLADSLLSLGNRHDILRKGAKSLVQTLNASQRQRMGSLPRGLSLRSARGSNIRTMLSEMVMGNDFALIREHANAIFKLAPDSNEQREESGQFRTARRNFAFEITQGDGVSGIMDTIRRVLEACKTTDSSLAREALASLILLFSSLAHEDLTARAAFQANGWATAIDVASYLPESSNKFNLNDSVMMSMITVLCGLLPLGADSRVSIARSTQVGRFIDVCQNRILRTSASENGVLLERCAHLLLAIAKDQKSMNMLLEKQPLLVSFLIKTFYPQIMHRSTNSSPLSPSRAASLFDVGRAKLSECLWLISMHSSAQTYLKDANFVSAILDASGQNQDIVRLPQYKQHREKLLALQAQLPAPTQLSPVDSTISRPTAQSQDSKAVALPVSTAASVANSPSVDKQSPLPSSSGKTPAQEQKVQPALVSPTSPSQSDSISSQLPDDRPMAEKLQLGDLSSIAARSSGSPTQSPTTPGSARKVSFAKPMDAQKSRNPIVTRVEALKRDDISLPKLEESKVLSPSSAQAGSSSSIATTSVDSQSRVEESHKAPQVEKVVALPSAKPNQSEQQAEAKKSLQEDSLPLSLPMKAPFVPSLNFGSQASHDSPDSSSSPVSPAKAVLRPGIAHVDTIQHSARGKRSDSFTELLKDHSSSPVSQSKKSPKKRSTSISVSSQPQPQETVVVKLSTPPPSTSSASKTVAKLKEMTRKTSNAILPAQGHVGFESKRFFELIEQYRSSSELEDARKLEQEKWHQERVHQKEQMLKERLELLKAGQISLNSLLVRNTSSRDEKHTCALGLTQEQWDRVQLELLDLDVDTITVGQSHLIIKTKDGKLFALGEAACCGLGQSKERTVTSLRQLHLAYRGVSSQEICPIAVYSHPQARHSFVICRIGNKNVVFAFGNNGMGQCGIGLQIPVVAVPRPVPLLDAPIVQDPENPPLPIGNVIKCAVGASHSLFLTDKGFVYACGSNPNGECGQGHCTAARLLFPVRVEDGLPPGVVDISATATASFVLSRGNHLVAFGKHELVDNGHVHTAPIRVSLQSQPAVAGIIAENRALYALDKSRSTLLYGWIEHNSSRANELSSKQQDGIKQVIQACEGCDAVLFSSGQLAFHLGASLAVKGLRNSGIGYWLAKEWNLRRQWKIMYESAYQKSKAEEVGKRRRTEFSPFKLAEHTIDFFIRPAALSGKSISNFVIHSDFALFVFTNN